MSSDAQRPDQTPPEDASAAGPGEGSGLLTADPTAVASGSVHLPASHRIAEDDTDAQITEKLRRQGVKIGKGMIAPRVFWPSLLIILAVAFIAVIFPGATDTVFNGVQGWIVSTLGWYYMLIIGLFVVFAIALSASSLGRIRLGKDDEKPEFGVFSWFAMLFAAGMGIGLVFYGVGEPLTFASVSPKPGWDGTQEEIAGLAMAQTFIHWGLHPWAIYAIIGLALAYSIHRRGRPVSIRWALEPLFGNKVKGWLGDAIDITAIFGTVFGVATSLGLGVQQIATGMNVVGLVSTQETWFLVVLIAVITFLATFSVISGLGAGIKWLSNINLSLAGLLLVTVLVFGPTVFLMQNFVQSIGLYLANLMDFTFNSDAFGGEEAAGWFSGWTIFYWGWWIAWAPFVGVFIARISRGRTVREFIAGVLIVPTIVGFFWFSVMGGSGLYRLLFEDSFLEDAGLITEDGGLATEKALFTVLGDLPLGPILSVIAIILVAIFFITSSDSGSLVVDMLASGGHPNPPAWSRVVWALLEGLLAAALLLAGGLGPLQAGSLITALPFSVILLLMCVATLRALKIDSDRIKERERQERLAALTAHVSEHVTEQVTDEVASTLGDQVTDRVTTHLDTRIGKWPQLEDWVDERIDYRISRTKSAFNGRFSALFDRFRRK
ncbi:BCCT family transporter [Brevibacterium litoralis]|uniref:BCCT family transporter n=1 Tax=Brevibacterium litoralis TaxID=3138935 RepID=UPI0032ED8EEA